ncbi:sarcinarray family MAST domain-containing protein [Methanosarcina horonobensis]|uniref:sarcinarray family MAST domain-containing protein n=1 Tax=Methanosarcina horonobensis TaxID=418008 RepID=UPI00064FCE30|nr:sarcinarray family MAST domain-containing protein [Methanosarcina horonobensis]
MKVKLIFSALLIFLLMSIVTLAESQYGSMDVYYNNKLLPGTEVAKPALKIGEPFNIKISLTVNQKSDVYASLSCMEKSSFEIIDGPTVRIGDYSKANILETNSTIEYEWTVKPTDKWAGGSLPLDIYYEIYDHGSPEPLIKGGFTVAYCTISNEHYEGEIPTSEEPQVSETESSPTSASTPAFTLAGAISVLALAFALFRR